jgi:hypothetical protein
MAGGLLLLSGCMLLPCPSGVRTKALLQDAYQAYQAGDNPQALRTIRLAIASAPVKKLPGYTLVELYDDAGLYYYINGQGRESFNHQSVAVLLAQVIETPEQMKRFYLKNLGTALAGSGFALELADIARNPRLLLDIPEVCANPHIRLYYGR